MSMTSPGGGGSAPNSLAKGDSLQNRQENISSDIPMLVPVNDNAKLLFHRSKHET